MTKDEALDLALEALEEVAARTGARWALEQGYAGHLEAITAIKQARALDKKADNARELGLDYEPSAKVRDFWEGYVPEPVKPAPVQEPVECQYGNGGYACCEGGPCKADEQNNAAQPAPVQEPVGRVCFEGDEVVWTDEPPESGTLLYTTPPAAQPAPASWTEIVTANLVREGVNKHKARELAEHFYSLAQRPFVGLTDEERDEILDIYITAEGRARAIEAKLRSKNNG